jgi:hypothetical protein
VYNNDFINTVKGRCLPPTDPSYLSTLGPVDIVVGNLSPNNPNLVGGTFSTLNENLVSGGLDLSVVCRAGYHFEPPSRDSWQVFSCFPNGVWMDPDILSIRRCVKDRLNCSYPLADLGGLWCEPMLPVLSEVRASYVDVHDELHFVPAVDAFTLRDVPVTGLVTLSIYGNAFFEPVQVNVGNVRCDKAILKATVTLPVSTVSYNISLTVPSLLNGTAIVHDWPQLVQGVYSQLIVCTLPPVIGVGMVVWVSTGRMGEVTEVDLSTSDIAATVSTFAPVLTLLAAPGACNGSLSPLVLTACPVRRAFNLTVCASIESVGMSSDQWTSGVSVVVSTAQYAVTLHCTHFGSDSAAGLGGTCASCEATPGLSELRLSLLRASLGQVSDQLGMLTFQDCPPGTRNDWAAASGVGNDLCQPCPPGMSTNGGRGLDSCLACAEGYYSNTSGAATCQACKAGTYAPAPGAHTCSRCPVNSFANATSQLSCEVCDLNRYIVYSPLDDGARVTGSCVDCPEQATCAVNGSVASGVGSYLLISQHSGRLQSVPCSSLACLDGSGCVWSEADMVALSLLSVLNCCASGRWPAYLTDPALYSDVSALQRDAGHNVLCAQCLPQHSQVNGRCIPCSSPHLLALAGLVAIAAALVLLVHTCPHDWSGSATLYITSNFLQLATLFLQDTDMPPLTSLLSLNLIGDHTAKGGTDTASELNALYLGYCVLPLTDSGRIVIALISPLIALALLGLVVGLQWAVRRFMEGRDGPAGGVSDRALISRLYYCLCIPTTPRLRRPGSGSGSLSEPLRSPSWLSTRGRGLSHYTFEVDVDHVPPPPPPPALRLAFLRSVVRLVLLSYTGLSVVSLAFFRTQDVGVFGQRVVDYPTLSPASEEWRRLQPWMVLVLVTVVCGMPLALFVWLLAEQQRGTLGGVWRVWEAEDGGGVVNAVGKDAEAEDEKADEDVSPSSRSSSSPPFASSTAPVSLRVCVLAQLVGMYRVSCWWMCPFVLVRRLLCIVLLTTVRSSAVWPWLTVVTVSAFALHTQVEPYARRRDNQLETMTLLSLSLQTALQTLSPPPHTQNPALTTALYALVVTPMLPPLLTALSTCCRVVKGGRKRFRSETAGIE